MSTDILQQFISSFSFCVPSPMNPKSIPAYTVTSKQNGAPQLQRPNYLTFGDDNENEVNTKKSQSRKRQRRNSANDISNEKIVTLPQQQLVKSSTSTQKCMRRTQSKPNVQSLCCEEDTVTEEHFLPPQSKNYEGKATLFLDLDNTIVHSYRSSVQFNDAVKKFSPARREDCFSIPAHFVCLRPHWRQFLDEILDLFEVVVWSTGSEKYVQAIVEYIDPEQRIAHVLTNEHSTNGCKSIARAGRDMKRCFLIDDLHHQPRANLMRIFRFDPKKYPEDDELFLMLPWLRLIAKTQEDILPILREWRHFMRERRAICKDKDSLYFFPRSNDVSILKFLHDHIKGVHHQNMRVASILLLLSTEEVDWVDDELQNGDEHEVHNLHLTPIQLVKRRTLKSALLVGAKVKEYEIIRNHWRALAMLAERIKGTIHQGKNSENRV